jgi:hypothetical protein
MGRPNGLRGDEVSASLLAGFATASDIGLYRRAGCPLGYREGRLRAWHMDATSTTFCRSGTRKRLLLDGRSCHLEGSQATAPVEVALAGAAAEDWSVPDVAWLQNTGGVVWGERASGPRGLGLLMDAPNTGLARV